MIILALMGRSGSGKSTAEKSIENMGFHRIISYTDRDMRPGEQNHREYHFVTPSEFDELIENEMLVEHAEYNNRRYGAPRPMGHDKYVIVVETNGFNTFKEMYGNQVIGIYLDVDTEEIKNRIKARGDTTKASEIERIAEDDKKFNEIKSIADYVIDANRPPVEVLADILDIVKKHR